MANFFDVLAALSLPVKVGWLLWLSWGLAHIMWQRSLRSVILPPLAWSRPMASVGRPSPAPPPVQEDPWHFGETSETEDFDRKN